MHFNRRLAAARMTAALLVIVAIVGADAFFEHVTRPFRASFRNARNLGERMQEHAARVDIGRVTKRSAPYLPDAGDFMVRASGHGRRTTAALGNSNSSGGDDSDFGAMCMFSRGPSLSKAPSLFFFSPKINSRGCAAREELQLQTINNDRELDAGPSRAMIQRELLDSKTYDPQKPTFFLIHGFMASWDSGSWMCDAKDLILSRTDANVFIVDWSGGSKPMLPVDYGAAVSNTQYVASLIGDFVNMLLEMSGQRDASLLRFIGHSLGAHISGFIGYKVGSVGQITALDPAGPCFRSNRDSASESLEASETGALSDGRRRLSPQSASLVLALHTDTSLFGLNENCGHYDVYVNGGAKQPGCSTLDAKDRLGDIMSGRLETMVDFDITCAHSYAHSLLDTFIPYSTLRQLGQRLLGAGGGGASSGRANRAPGGNLLAFSAQGRSSSGPGGAYKLDKCYPMAYECAHWDAFKAGECGFCRDNDTACVYTGLSLDTYMADRAPRRAQAEKYAESGEAPPGDDADLDYELNGENGNSLDGYGGRERADAKWNSRGQHFIKTAGEELSCTFQYQIIVAAKRSSSQRAADASDYHYYYLHLPLERSGLLSSNGEPLHARLVQVSHRLEPESAAYARLTTNYMSAIAERSSSDSFDGSRDELDFYTALITFRQIPEDRCLAGDATNGQADCKDQWQMCDTLDNMQEARLWSPRPERLDAIAWVALNFMSGLEYEQRMNKSYVMGRGDSRVNDRRALDEGKRAKLIDLNPDKPKSLGSAMSDAQSSADCAMNALNLAGMSSTAKTNIKCRRDDDELAYALDLTPRKNLKAQA